MQHEQHAYGAHEAVLQAAMPEQEPALLVQEQELGLGQEPELAPVQVLALVQVLAELLVLAAEPAQAPALQQPARLVWPEGNSDASAQTQYADADLHWLYSPLHTESSQPKHHKGTEADIDPPDPYILT